jgi:hypothetical protein
MASERTYLLASLNFQIKIPIESKYIVTNNIVGIIKAQ